MNLADVKQTLCNYFEGAHTSTQISFGNEVFDTEPFWVRMTVRELSREQITMGPEGARKFESRCAVFVQVFSPVEGAFRSIRGGEFSGTQLAEDIRRLFEGKTIAPAKFQAAHIDAPVRDDASKGRWWMQVVTANFFFFEVA